MLGFSSGKIQRGLDLKGYIPVWCSDYQLFNHLLSVCFCIVCKLCSLPTHWYDAY